MNNRPGDVVHQMRQGHIALVCRKEHLDLSIVRINENTLRLNYIAKIRLGHLKAKINHQGHCDIEEKFFHKYYSKMANKSL